MIDIPDQGFDSRIAAAGLDASPSDIELANHGTSPFESPDSGYLESREVRSESCKFGWCAEAGLSAWELVETVRGLFVKSSNSMAPSEEMSV